MISSEEKKLLGTLFNSDLESLDNNQNLFELVNFKMGEIIISPKDVAKNIFILINGQLRFRSIPDSKNKVFTLGLEDKQIIFGDLSSRYSQNIELVSASTECKTIKISKNNWNKFIETFNPKWDEIYRLGLSEAFFLINSKKLNINYPKDAKSLRRYLSSFIKKTLVLNPSFQDLNNQDFDLNDYNLFKFDYDKFQDFRPIEKDDFLELVNKKTDTRIIGVLKTLSTMEISDLIQSESNNKNIQESNLSPESEIKGNTDDIKENTENIEKDSPKTNLKYKFYSSAPGPINESLACFQMLCRDLNLPFKSDVLSKILSEEINKEKNFISLNTCAGIGEFLGLRCQIGKIPKDVITRVETPAFIQLANKRILIVLESNKFGLVIGDPLTSIDLIEYEKLDSFFSEQETIDIVLFQKTYKTPQKRFGLSWFKPAIKKHRKALIDVLIASIFVQVFQLMNPLIIQQIIDKVIGQNGINTLPVLAVLLFVFSFFENTLTAVRTNLFIDTTNRIDISLGEQVIDHLLRLPLSYFDKRPVGELSTRLGELEQIRSFLTGTALTVVLDAIFSILYIVVMLFYSWILTIVALLLAPLLGLITFTISPVIRRQLRTKAELNANTQNHLVEVLTGIQTVKAQNIELNARWRWRERYSKYVSEGFKNAVTSTTTDSLTQFLNQVSALSVICVGSYLVLKGQLTLGELIAFRIISGYVTAPLLRLSNLYQSFQQTSISLERLGDILNTTQESSTEEKSKIPMKPIKGKVKFEDISFSFKERGPLIISQLSAEINEGEFVAIVGQSGSGKSTLTKLIPRLYDPSSGKIIIDNYDISKVELYSLRRQIGIVPQDTLLFDGSIQENIALTNPDANSEEVIRAAKVACAHDFIMSTPTGYSSKVGERGGGLSGGQRQRIAIARTVLQNPQLLIMDEATSALDYQTERKVSLNLMEYFRGKTVFFITHRLNSIKNADRIILMHDGVIDEQGTHQELLEKKGRYYSLFLQQESSNETEL